MHWGRAEIPVRAAKEARDAAREAQLDVWISACIGIDVSDVMICEGPVRTTHIV